MIPERHITGLVAALTRAENASTNGAYAELDLKTVAAIKVVLRGMFTPVSQRPSYEITEQRRAALVAASAEHAALVARGMTRREASAFRRQMKEDARRKAEKAEKDRIAGVWDRLRVINAKVELADAILDKWLLPDGTPLGDATWDKLLLISVTERNQEAAHAKNADFYERLSDRTTADKTVRECMSAEDVQRICDEVFANVPPRN